MRGNSLEYVGKQVHNISKLTGHPLKHRLLLLKILIFTCVLTCQKHDFHTSRVKLLFCSSQSSCSPFRALTAVIPHGRGRNFNPTGEFPCGRCRKKWLQRDQNGHSMREGSQGQTGRVNFAWEGSRKVASKGQMAIP